VLAISAVGVVTLAVAGLLLLHTSMVQSRILAWSISELERRFDLDLTADKLSYNLARRRVTLTNVRLAAKGHLEYPFFAANNVTVQLPWAAFRGTLRFDDIEVDDGRVFIFRDENGVSNLPTSRAQRDPNLPPRKIDARGLTVRNLDFHYRDLQRDIEISGEHVRTDLKYAAGEGATGPFVIDSNFVVRVGQRSVVISPINGNGAFDGSNVTLANVNLKTKEGVVTVNGPITRVFDQATLNLTFKGTADIERAALWAPPPVHVAGAATIDGTVKGAPTQFVLNATVAAPAAEVGREHRVRLQALSELSPNGLKVSKAVLHPATGGEVVAAVDFPFGKSTPWWLTANYSELDAATAFRLAEVDPLPFGAAIKGTVRLDAKPGQPFRLEIHNSSTPRTARGTAPLSGDVEFFVEGNRWRAGQRHRIGATAVSGRLAGTWNRQVVTRSTFSGRLDVRTGNVGEAARYAALFGLTTPAIVRNSSGPMDALVDVTGQFNAPRFIGTAHTTGLDVPTFGHAAFTANFDASARALNVTNIDGTVGTAQLKGDVLANFSTRQLGGSLAIDAPSARDLLTGVPEALQLEGALAATASLGGTVDTPDIAADVVGTGMTLGGQPVDSLTAKARVLGNDVIVESLTLTQGAGSLTASGRYSMTARTYTVDLQGQGIEWQGSIGQLGNAKARFSVRFTGSGNIDSPTGEGAIDFDLTGGLAGALVGHGTANVRLNGDVALVTTTIPSLGAFIDAKITPRQPFSYDAILVANRIDIEQLIRLSGLHEGYVTGTASLSATASGVLSDLRNSHVFINLQDIAAAVEGVTVKLAAPSRLSWDGTGLTVDTLDLSVGETGRLHASGRLAETGAAKWDSTFSGELGDLLRIGRPFGVPPELQASGPVNIVWQSTGGLDQSVATMQLAGGSVTWGTLPSVTNLTVDARFNGSTLDVSRLTGEWQGGGIEGTASIPRGVLEGRTGTATPAQGFAKLRVVGLTENAFAPWIGPAALKNIDGRLSATLDATITTASLEGLSGNLTLDEASFTVAAVPVEQARPSVLSIDGGTLVAKDVVWSIGGLTGPTGTTTPAASELTLTGSARFLPADKAALDFQLKGNANLRVLSAFAPTVAVDGLAKVNIGFGGSPSTPVFNGRVDVTDSEVLIREPRIVLGDLKGTIAFDGRRVLFDSFNGTANGGALVLDGGFLLAGAHAVGGALTLQMQGAALEYPRALQSESDAILTLRPDATGWSLTGDVIVARSVFNQAISIAALAAARQTRAPRPPGEVGSLDQLHLNVSVSTQEDLRVDNNYARLEAGGAVRVLGTAEEPILGGRITLREGGEVYLAGRTYHVTRGNISFSDPNRIEPEFDVELQTRVAGTDIAVTLSGPMERLQTEVRSTDPDIDSREAMTMLFGDLRGEDAVTLLSAELLGATGRAVGLDTLRIERGFETDEFRADPGLIATETDPSTRLTLSKRLRPDIELTLSQSLRESGALSAVISYKPRRNIEMRVISRDNVDRAIALRHEIVFGSSTATQAERPAQPKISAVTFSGDLGRSEPELRSLLKLDVGDEFDFYSWQRDIDKIRDDYQDRGYYEVRIRGTRHPADDGQTIALDYNVVPGPLAELVITGHPLEPKLEKELRDSWRRTIFDRFLIEDIQSRIRRHLVSEDVIGSKVEAVVALSTPERKQVRVTVEAGTKVSSRKVRYSGNATIDAGHLDQAITDASVEIDAWLEPRRLAETLESYYRNHGFLEVAVNAGEPEVSGSAAVLPVTVEEGRRYLVDAITFRGVHPDRQIEVAQAAALELRMPYVTDDMDAARRRVQDVYELHGFNTARVEVDPNPNKEEGVVDVAFTVTEGPQQVVREVTTQGVTQTREGVINKALRLREGDPVNLAAWSQARKRMYDTNVFRQVDLDPVPIEQTAEDKAAGVQPVRAVVRVIEYPVWRLRYGLQVNDERTNPDTSIVEQRSQSLGILTDLRNQNLFGRAITAGIAGRYDRDRRSESLFLSNSSFFGLPIRTNGFIFDARQRFRTDNAVTAITDRHGLSVEQRWRPSRRAEVTYGYRYERNRTFDPRPPNPGLVALDIPLNISKLTGAALIDRRDDPFQPTTGWFSSANWDQALSFLGSDFRTSKLLVQQLYFRSLGRLVLASRAQLGVEFSRDDLVFTERFQLGGATTVRGYGENSLGPRDLFGFPRGGDALLLLNAEARFPVRGWVQGVGFIDAGNVFLGKRDLSIGDLKVGYGIGLRFASPFAMLRVDYGIATSVLPPVLPDHPNPRGRFYIGIGHIF